MIAAVPINDILRSQQVVAYDDGDTGVELVSLAGKPIGFVVITRNGSGELTYRHYSLGLMTLRSYDSWDGVCTDILTDAILGVESEAKRLAIRLLRADESERPGILTRLADCVAYHQQLQECRASYEVSSE